MKINLTSYHKRLDQMFNLRPTDCLHRLSSLVFEKGLGRPLGQSVIGLTSVHKQGQNQSERQVDMVLCAGDAARGAERGLNFVVWNFAWDRLASRQWLQILKSCHNFKFCKKHYTWHFLKLLDKICKYEMDPTRTVGATEGMWDGRTDRRTDGVKPIYPPTTLLFGGYNYVTAMSYPASLVKQHKISIELSL